MALIKLDFRRRKGIFALLLIAVLLLLLYYRFMQSPGVGTGGGVGGPPASAVRKDTGAGVGERGSAGGGKVRLVGQVFVEVYFSSLCPDSTVFLAQQLMPFWKTRFHKLVHLDLVPYGKASYETDHNGKTSFSCQHGPDECYLNKAMACAIKKLYTDTGAALKVISCLQGGEPKDALKCTTGTQLTSAQMQVCIDGPAGDEILKKMAAKTDAVKAKRFYVPTVFINGRANKNAEFHFHMEVCKVLPADQRKQCLEEKA